MGSEMCIRDRVHIVDLEGARKGEPAHKELIIQLAKISPLEIEVGGGIRRLEVVEEYLEAGVSRVILGTVAHSQPELVDELVARKASPGHLPDPIGFAATLTPVSTDVLPLYLTDKLVREGVEVLLGWALAGVRCRQDKLLRIRLHAPSIEPSLVREIAGRYFIDATGSAVLLRLAGEEVVVPARPQAWTHIFTLAPVDSAEILAYIERHPRDFVLAENWVERMRKYLAVSGFFGLVRGARESAEFPVPRDRLLLFGGSVAEEITVNTTRVFPPKSYFRRSTAERARLAGRLRTEALGQVAALARWMRTNVPGFKRAEIHRLAPEIGVRESFRLRGRYILKARDVIGGRSFPDAVALASYPIDVHVSGSAELKTKQLDARGLYEIPLRCLQPRRLLNVLAAGRCLSADSAAYASARVTPIAMALGQAAGMAAATLVRGENAVTESILRAVSDAEWR